MHKEPKSLTFDEFADELLAESQPRALVILASAKLDTQLRQAIEGFIWPKFGKARDEDELFDGLNPLSSFSARIKIALRLGLIDKSLSDALNMLREVRNQAAHWTSFGVTDSPLKDQLRHLQSLVNKRSSYKLTVAKFLGDGVLNDLESVKAVLLTLCVLLESIQIKMPERSLAKIQNPFNLN